MKIPVQKAYRNRDYYDALGALVLLRPVVDDFFDEVLVMSPNKVLKKNRLALLEKISRTFVEMIDFRQIELEA
ncbi:hypothetical protein IID04_04965 [PVC group bacterium]|nr:hypothetical protein [PVC group bacterium]